MCPESMDKVKFILSDDELWEKFIAGDDNSITTVYKRHVNDLFTYGLKIVNDQSLVKDCIQDVFLKLISGRRKLVVGSHIHIYLFKSLRNRLLDEIRSTTRKNEIRQLLNVSKDNTFTDSIEKQIILDEERLLIHHEIKNALNDLTGKQKEIIYLKYTKGLSYDEIALTLQIDKASVRTLLYRTLKTVKEKLNKNVLILLTFFDLRSKLRNNFPNSKKN